MHALIIQIILLFLAVQVSYQTIRNQQLTPLTQHTTKDKEKPNMAAVLLPPTFHNSFWSNQDYFRTGLEVLMGKLKEGCEESVEIGVFIKVLAYGTFPQGIC